MSSWHPDARQQPQVDGEDDDEYEAEPERGNGVSSDAEHADEPVDPRAAPERRDHTERYADDELQEQSGARELERVRKALEQHHEGIAVVDERVAELAAKGVGDPVDVLERQRLVEPVRVEEPVVVVLREVLDAEGEEADRVTRGEAGDGECDDRDPDERWDRVKQPSRDEVAQRSSVRGSAFRRSPCRSTASRRYCFTHHWNAL